MSSCVSTTIARRWIWLALEDTTSLAGLRGDTGGPAIAATERAHAAVKSGSRISDCSGVRSCDDVLPFVYVASIFTV